MDDLPLVDHAGLTPAERESLGRAVAGHTTLERALEWARAHTPPLGVESVLTQDEYTHDVLIPYGSRYLVYDTS
ncbi:MAG TPA: hypothetical protein VL563_00720 [Gemmatimonadales bacterium]|jgi:hypothetical protein|nr:hypothetical protein [Gemmatimonadales bacterium]